MNRSRVSARSTSVLLVTILFAACSTAGSPSNPPATTTPAGSPTAGASSGASPSAALDTTPVQVAWESSPDETYLPTLMAIDAMKQQGYNITAQQLASDPVVVQALASNTVQFTRYSLQGLAQAVQQGVPLKAVSSVDRNTVTWVVATGYEDCSKLDGKPVGIYSPTAGYTIEQNIYFAKNCPNVKPTFVSIPDSLLRAQALAAGQILASALGSPDALNLKTQYPGKFSFVDFGTALPALDLDYIMTNTQTLKDHPSIVEALVREQLKAVRQLYTDPTSASGYLTKFLPSVKSDAVAQQFIATKIWYANGGFGGTGLEGGIQAFGVQGDRSTLTDQGPMTAALKEIGNSDLTQY
jgi:ABC-type nitrate/sulfonate/bicarbonate transport system substrate-binding protein